jgi:hypothetical protein
VKKKLNDEKEYMLKEKEKTLSYLTALVKILDSKN